MFMLFFNHSYQRNIGQPLPQGLSEILKSLQSLPDKVLCVTNQKYWNFDFHKVSPFLIPGTEVSEKLNGVHGFMVEKNIKSQNIHARKKKLKDQTFSVGGTSLIIEQHPEEYLEELSKKSRPIVEIDNHKEQNDRSLDEKEIAKEKKEETPENFFQIDSSGSYSVFW